MSFLAQCGQFTFTCKGSTARIGTSLWRPDSLSACFIYSRRYWHGLPAATLALMRGATWAFALCFAAITVVSWRYLFIIPIAFSIVITLCLTAAAWLSARQVSMPPLR